MKSILIGVLALQGDFAKHIQMLQSMGVETKEVRKPDDLSDCDGLIIPGGESTVILRQLSFIDMTRKLCDFAEKKPVFGTCAGLILMSSEVDYKTDRTNQKMEPLGLLSIRVERNAFGRQNESFQAKVELHLDSDHLRLFQAFFIRAPRIRTIDPGVKVLASYENEPVLVQQGHLLGASFHPELTPDTTIHKHFLDMVKHRILASE